MADCRFKVLVCRGPTCGTQHGSSVLMEQLKNDLAECQLAEQVELGWQSCFGRCSQGPNMLVRDRGAEGAGAVRAYAVAAMPERRGRAALYSHLRVADMRAIVEQHIGGGQVVRRLLSRRPQRPANAEEPAPAEHRLPQVLASVRGQDPDGDGA